MVSRCLFLPPPLSATPPFLLGWGPCSAIPQKAKEGIKRKIAKGADQSEIFDAVVSVQRQLILFHERKEGMQLVMDRSLAILAQLRKEEIQVQFVPVVAPFAAIIACSWASYFVEVYRIYHAAR